MSLPGRSVNVWLVVGAIVLMGVGGLFFVHPKKVQHGPVNTVKVSDVRDQYASLYQAAYRQDSGQGSMTISATLFTPKLISLLGTDTQRSGDENQLWRAVNDASDKQLTIFLTIDSVGAPVADKDLTDSLSLTAAGNQKFTLTEWRPLIVPSRIVNTDASASSQSGVVIFSSDQTIDWTQLEDLRLSSRNLGDQPVRQFIWASLALLQAEQ